MHMVVEGEMASLNFQPTLEYRSEVMSVGLGSKSRAINRFIEVIRNFTLVLDYGKQSMSYLASGKQ